MGNRVREAVLGVLVVALCSLNVWQAWPDWRLDRQREVDRFHRMFYESQVWYQNRWLGVRTMQNPNDVWVMQEILFDVKPDFLVETGTAEGGSAALWATVLAQVKPSARIVTVDIEDLSAEARKLPVVQERVDFLLGSSTDPAIVADIQRRVAGGTVMVLLDSDHSQKHVEAELRAYAPMVSVGSYLVVQDTNVNGHPVNEGHGPGPMEALLGFLAKDDRFVVDRSRERLLFTMHPSGYLKRVR